MSVSLKEVNDHCKYDFVQFGVISLSSILQVQLAAALSGLARIKFNNYMWQQNHLQKKHIMRNYRAK
jgi:hypothetical protein